MSYEISRGYVGNDVLSNFYLGSESARIASGKFDYGSEMGIKSTGMGYGSLEGKALGTDWAKEGRIS